MELVIVSVIGDPRPTEESRRLNVSMPPSTTTYPIEYELQPHDGAGSGLGPTGTMVLGAAAGLVFGYLYLTDSGRQLRARLDPLLDTWIAEMRSLRATADKAREAFSEGRDSFAAMRGVTHAREDAW